MPTRCSAATSSCWTRRMPRVRWCSSSASSASADPRRRAVAAGPVGLLGLGLLLGTLVHGLGDLVERGLQRVGLGADVVGVLAGQRVADRLDRLLDLRLGVGVDLVAEL